MRLFTVFRQPFCLIQGMDGCLLFLFFLSNIQRCHQLSFSLHHYRLFSLSLSLLDAHYNCYYHKVKKKLEEREGEEQRVFGVVMSSTSTQGNTYDLSFKILLIGDSGVGKSSLLVSFISNTVVDLSPTIGITLFTLLFLFIRLFDVGLNLLSQTH